MAEGDSIPTYKYTREKNRGPAEGVRTHVLLSCLATLSKVCHRISLCGMFVISTQACTKVDTKPEKRVNTRCHKNHGKAYSTLMAPMSKRTAARDNQILASTHASFSPSVLLWETVTSSVVVRASLALPQEARRRLQIAVGV